MVKTMIEIQNLIDAVLDGNVDLLSKLLADGANPNASEDDAQITPLHFAAQNNQIKAADLLLNAGADIHAKTMPDGHTAYEIALLHGHTQLAQMLASHADMSDTQH